jgi:hypothetical protein
MRSRRGFGRTQSRLSLGREFVIDAIVDASSAGDQALTLGGRQLSLCRGQDDSLAGHVQAFVRVAVIQASGVVVFEHHLERAGFFTIVRF